MAEVAFVVPVHNRAAVTRTFLQALARQDQQDFVVVVVDAGSTDDTALMLAAAPLPVHVVRGDASWFWGRGTAEGIAAVAAAQLSSRVVMINDDLELRPDYVRRLLATMQAHPDAVVGSTAVEAAPPHRIYAIGGTFLPLLGRVSHRRRRWRPLRWLPGMGMGLSIATYQRVGGIDWQRFPHYGSDFEFSWRARRQGVPLVVSDASVYVDAGRAGRKIPASSSWSAFAQHLLDQRFDENVVWKRSFYEKNWGPVVGVAAAARFAAEATLRRCARRARARL